ncbi:MAG: hypothetical protein Q4E12_02525 [Coriobacteriia bacterium]|nr:hypothetical protein [Coriobacteriia bacterium]
MASEPVKRARHAKQAVPAVATQVSLTEAACHKHADAGQSCAAARGRLAESPEQPLPRPQGKHAAPAHAGASSASKAARSHASASRHSAGKHRAHAKRRSNTAARIAIPAAAVAAAVALGVGVVAYNAQPAQQHAAPVVAAEAWTPASGDPTVVTMTRIESNGLANDAKTQAQLFQEFTDRIAAIMQAEYAQREADRLALEQEMARLEAEREAFAHTQQTALELSLVPDLFLAQGEGTVTCTLVSNAMMLRRAAYHDGRTDWKDVTEEAVGDVAWGGDGMQWGFTSFGYDVTHGSMESEAGEARVAEIVALLKVHPEGVVLYDPDVPHAVLAIYYDEQTKTLFCADPAPYYAGRALPASETWNGTCHGNDQQATIDGFTEFWCLTRELPEDPSFFLGLTASEEEQDTADSEAD